MLQEEADARAAALDEENRMSSVLLQNERLLFQQASDTSAPIFSARTDDTVANHSKSRKCISCQYSPFQLFFILAIHRGRHT